ncbi:alpha/beta fold hydrolase [Fluviicola chungangensis]|uniref:Alpha/beta hydrolase n=1 Tax=Fluviicola chungangensis TaxID=2597671 RepID=A0A556MJE0_9FLAO|nr:alpha/beta hydrolase [Fluviicola chungangensis]TSJ40018.1 alpha/beta hydrolase [Fluviicola chungangensis]
MRELVILHGALGAKAQFKQLESRLADHFNVYTLDFDGHGAKSGIEMDFSIEHFVQNVKNFMQENNLEKPLIFGYSMGGYVALKLESLQPGSFEQIITLGTKFDWNPESAEKEAKMLNAEKIEEKVPAFANYLKSLHGEAEWKMVLQRTAKMMLELGKKPSLKPYDFHHIQIPVLLLLGEKDVMVTKEETKHVRELLRNASFEEVPDWVHPINQVPLDELVQQLLNTQLNR